MKLKRNFYLQPTIDVAQKLIGKFLIHKVGKKFYEAQIIETEAYAGFDDKASHASRGKTERNKVMFNEGGCAYVYLIYGMYHCFNVVTEKEGYPAAVLIRGLDYPKADGPGKLCREFKISKKRHNGISLLEDVLWIEDRGINIETDSGKRIGVDYADECALWPRRFLPR